MKKVTLQQSACGSSSRPVRCNYSIEGSCVRTLNAVRIAEEKFVKNL